MFTGLIEEVGRLKAITKGSSQTVLTIAANTVLDETTRIGDSIAVNGVCLTVTAIGAGSYQVDVMNETLNRSSLGLLKPGSPVNLERAMLSGGRFGGHIVSGHIDGIGTVTDITKDGNAVWYTIQTKQELLRYVVEKGSIAMDGISLTVADVTKESFSVSTIPHTRSMTNLSTLEKGSIVNLECDIIGKYVERLCRQPMGEECEAKSHINMEFLAEHGFV